jgi:hypothetical protein
MGHSGLTEIKSETRQYSSTNLPCKKTAPPFPNHKACDVWFRMHRKFCQECAGTQLNKITTDPVITYG